MTDFFSQIVNFRMTFHGVYIFDKTSDTQM